MKRAAAVITVLAIAALALPALAGEEEYRKCEMGVEACLKEHAAMLKKRGWVGLEMDYTEDGNLYVKKVIADSPAKKAGFEKGDVLTAVNGVAHSEENKAALKEVWDSMKPGDTMKYGVDRAGKPVTLEVKLASIPDSVMAQWIGQHMLMAHLDAPAEEPEAGS